MEQDRQLAKALSLLESALYSLHCGYVGGEWSALMPEEINFAAAKEQDEAMKTLQEIRDFLKENHGRP